MFKAKHPLHLTPVGLVLIPIGVASVLTGSLGFAIGLSGRWAVVSQAPLMITAILIYAATLFFIGRSGIATIRGLEQRAHVDSLTGLPNRHALHEEVQFLSCGDDEVALAMIDLDSFKQVNDHYGHAVGDQLIELCGEVLREVWARKRAATASAATNSLR